MNIDHKMLMDLAGQLGMDDGKQSKVKRTADLADKYKGKSDQELLQEITKLKNSMKNDKAQFEKQMKAIKSLSVMMNNEQKARLEKVIRLLESDE